MKLKKILFYLTSGCFLVFNTSFSQNINDYIYTIQINNDNEYKNLVGTSYINPEFLPAIIPESTKTYLMRFNAFQDEMEIAIDGSNMFIIKRLNFPVTFTNEKKVYQVFEFDKSGENTSGFFVVLYQEKGIYLLLKETIKFTPEEPAKSGYDKYKPPTLTRVKDQYYIGYKNNTALELPVQKKDFFNLFGSKATAVESYAKENKLGNKSTEDLVKIFKYYNSL
jgi:hypothetical protein